MKYRNIYPEHVLDVLSQKFNDASRAAAYMKACEHDAYKTNAVAASVLLETITELFPKKTYFVAMVPETLNGKTFEWRKLSPA